MQYAARNADESSLWAAPRKRCEQGKAGNRGSEQQSAYQPQSEGKRCNRRP
jgi:hypothetical protein